MPALRSSPVPSLPSRLRTYRLRSIAPITALVALAGIFQTPSSAHATTLRQTYEFDASRIRIVRGADGAATIFQESLPATWEAGQPELPFDVVTLLVPRGARLGSLRVEAADEIVVAEGIRLREAGDRWDEAGHRIAPKPARLVASALMEPLGKAGKPAAVLAHAGFDAALYPAVRIEPAGGGALHGYQVMSVRVYPVRWDPARGRLTATRRLQLELDLESGGALPLDRERYSPAIERRAREQLERIIANPRLLDGYDRRIGQRVVPKPSGRFAPDGAPGGGFRPTDAPGLEGSAVEAVIVTSQALSSTWQVLADWKTRRGVPTVVRTTEWILANYRHGSDLQETIRTFVRDAYLKWGVQWVLLAGDTDVIPARYGFSGFGEPSEQLIPTDMYYACLDGNWNRDGDGTFGEAAINVSNPGDSTDLYAEVFVGRAPMSLAPDAGALVNKIIAYENPAQTSYQKRLLLFGEVLAPVDWTQGDPITLDGGAYCKEMLSLAGSCTDSTELYDNYTEFPGSLPLSRSAALAQMNAGPGFVNHIGHGYRYNMSLGDVSMTNNDALALTNVDRRFVLYMLNCTAGAFDFPCLAEAFLRSAGGAVCVLGSSRSAYAVPARNYNKKFFEALHVNGYTHVGEAFVQSRLPFTPAAYFDTADRYSHFLYNLLGDPEMVVHTCELAPTQATYPASVGLGPTSLAVHVTAGGSPRAGALVCVSKGTAGTEAYEFGTTDANGDVTLAFRPESAGTAQLTVSGANMTTHLGSITVEAQPGAYVHLASVAIDDDATGGSLGNADGVLDAGETVQIDLGAANDGPTAATGVTGVLHITGTWSTVTDSTFTLGNLAGSGGTASSTHEVTFMVSASTPDGTVLPIGTQMTNGSSTWTDTVRRVVHAPDVRLVRLRVEDPGPGGNGDGIIQAGETFDLVAYFKNYGTGAADGLAATLATLDPDVTIIQNTVDIGRDAPQQEVTGATRFRLSESVLAENALDLGLQDSWGRTRNWSITLRGPAQLPTPALSTKAGAGIVTATWTPSSATDLAGYHVYRGLSSTGPWTRVSVDRTLRTAYFQDTGLAASTLYWYYVTALDHSGNESVPSLVASINTNPAQLSGWPIQLGAQSSCPLAAGDITGDGSKEIVAGNDHLYAWNWNGLEVRDDDNDPLTWGIFSQEVQIVTGAVALAEMDGNPGLETFVTSWNDSNKTYCVRGDGTFLPGWPRNPGPYSPIVNNNGYWAASAAVDVDADGRAELFAPAKNGNLYAWHADGTPLGIAEAFKSGLGINQRTSPAFANLDADPELEIVYGAQNGQLFIWNIDGSNFPNFPVSPGTLCLSNVAVGDVNHDGVQDVVMLTEGGGGFVHVYSTATGAELAGWPRTFTIKGNPISPSPALADFDGDGFLEIVVANDGGSSAPQLSAVQILNYQGNLLPGWPKSVGPYNSESSPIVADMSGDGVPDVLFGNEGGQLFGWDRFGNNLPGFPITIGDFIRSTPLIDDVDGDGYANLLLAGWDKNVYIWDFQAPWSPAAAQWPTLKHDVHRSGTYGFVFDIAPPTPPTSLVSTTHTTSAWSNNPQVGVAWSGASDASGIGGYSIEWDTSPATLPDPTIDTTLQSAVSPSFGEGQSYWFHLRTVDTRGHWTAAALHLGPFWIDVTPPANSASATPDRPAATWSADNTIGVTWVAAVDPMPFAKASAGGAPVVAGSGIAGYSIVWDTNPTTIPDEDIETASLSTVSPALGSGQAHRFHLRAVDAAGNAADEASVLHLGPFWVDATPPAALVLAPNGGEVWGQNSVETIRWRASDQHSGVAALELRYSTDGGATYPHLIASPQPTDSTFAWTVPLDLTNQARVRVQVTDVVSNIANDASDANFTLSTPTATAGLPPVTRTWLENPAPNPFNPTTRLRYSLAEAGHVQLVLFDARGRRVRQLVDAQQTGGRWYEVLWNGTDAGGRSLPSGTYFARLRTPAGSWSHRLVLAK